MRNKNWFWGFFFLLSAVFVIAGEIGSFGDIGIMSLLATVFLLALVIKGLFSLSFFEIFVPLAFLYMIYWKPLELTYISPWLLVLSAVMISIGFSLLFGRPSKKVAVSHEETKHCSPVIENIDNNNPYTKVTFSSSSIYLHSECLQGGQFISSFGALEVYFDQAQLSLDGAKIFLDCNLSSIKLYIPRHWHVVDNIHSTLGDVNNDNRHAKPSENAPQLTLVGKVFMGSIEIHYI